MEWKLEAFWGQLASRGLGLKWSLRPAFAFEAQL